MNDKHVKGCSTPLVTKKIEIKTTLHTTSHPLKFKKKLKKIKTL
jgi:hypothetical protein